MSFFVCQRIPSYFSFSPPLTVLSVIFIFLNPHWLYLNFLLFILLTCDLIPPFLVVFKVLFTLTSIFLFLTFTCLPLVFLLKFTLFLLFSFKDPHQVLIFILVNKLQHLSFFFLLLLSILISLKLLY